MDPNRIYKGQFGRVVLLEMARPLVEHAHSQYHLLFKIAGADGTMSIRDKAVPLSDETVVLVNAWEPHGFLGCQHGTALVLAFYLEPEWFAGLKPVQWPLGFGRHCVARTLELRRVVNRFIGHMLYDEALECATLEKLVTDAAFSAASDARAAASVASDFRISRVIQFMRSNPGVPLTGQQLASLAGLSTGHFFERFRTCTGLTPCTFWNVVRMEAALSALTDETVAIARVSERLGFCAHANFTRFFRQHVGISPAMYRRVVQVVQ